LYTYQVLALTLGDPIQMEHEELETITVLFWHGGERFTEVVTALGLVSNG
jgi:hypothetical protein